MFDVDHLAALLEVQERRLDELAAENTALALGFSVLTDLLVEAGRLDPKRLRAETARTISLFEAGASAERAEFLARTRRALAGLLDAGGSPADRVDGCRTH